MKILPLLASIRDRRDRERDRRFDLRGRRSSSRDRKREGADRKSKEDKFKGSFSEGLLAPAHRVDSEDE